MSVQRHFWLISQPFEMSVLTTLLAADTSPTPTTGNKRYPGLNTKATTQKEQCKMQTRGMFSPDSLLLVPTIILALSLSLGSVHKAFPTLPTSLLYCYLINGKLTCPMQLSFPYNLRLPIHTLF